MGSVFDRVAWAISQGLDAMEQAVLVALVVKGREAPGKSFNETTKEIAAMVGPRKAGATPDADQVAAAAERLREKGLIARVVYHHGKAAASGTLWRVRFPWMAGEGDGPFVDIEERHYFPKLEWPDGPKAIAYFCGLRAKHPGPYATHVFARLAERADRDGRLSLTQAELAELVGARDVLRPGRAFERLAGAKGALSFSMSEERPKVVSVQLGVPTIPAAPTRTAVPKLHPFTRADIPANRSERGRRAEDLYPKTDEGLKLIIGELWPSTEKMLFDVVVPTYEKATGKTYSRAELMEEFCYPAIRIQTWSADDPRRKANVKAALERAALLPNKHEIRSPGSKITAGWRKLCGVPARDAVLAR